MAEKTMTRVKALEIAIAEVDNAEAIAVLTKLRDQLAKPKAKAETATHKQNVAEAKKLYEVAPADAFTTKFVQEHTSAMTPQKAVGVMRAGIELGLFEKDKDGKQTIYRKL